MTQEQIQTQEAMDGTPSHIKTEFYDIKFQCGPVKEFGVNGCQIDDIIDNVILPRLRAFQNGPFKSRETALQITKIEEGQLWSRERTRLRELQKVEGENKAHVS